MFEAGMILQPDDAEWADDYVESMTRFPKGQHDDDVDTSQALNYLRRRQHGVMEYIERELAKENEKNLCANEKCARRGRQAARTVETTAHGDHWIRQPKPRRRASYCGGRRTARNLIRTPPRVTWLATASWLSNSPRPYMGHVWSVVEPSKGARHDRLDAKSATTP
jgi:hypothetical protein